MLPGVRLNPPILVIIRARYIKYIPRDFSNFGCHAQCLRKSIICCTVYLFLSFPFRVSLLVALFCMLPVLILIRIPRYMLSFSPMERGRESEREGKGVFCRNEKKANFNFCSVCIFFHGDMHDNLCPTCCCSCSCCSCYCCV